MSGSTIGGFAGALIGGYIGGQQGAQIGWMIGSAVGGYVDPEKIVGPRLTDAAQQAASAGIPITFGYGTFPTTGNIIWVQPGPPTEHENEERTGKGGPVQVTYTYTRSYAIGICEGPITGLLIIKRNGKIVYDVRPDEVLAAAGMTPAQISQSRAASAAFLSKCTIYTGDETQVADPTIEAWEGVGNVPGHRGLAYMVVHDDDVTELRGAVPQYEFVVNGIGSIVGGAGQEWNDYTKLTTQQPYAIAISPHTILIAGHGGDLEYSSNRGGSWNQIGGLWISPYVGAIYNESEDAFYIANWDTSITGKVNLYLASEENPSASLVFTFPSGAPYELHYAGGQMFAIDKGSTATPAVWTGSGNSWTQHLSNLTGMAGLTFNGAVSTPAGFVLFSGGHVVSSGDLTGFSHVAEHPLSIEAAAYGNDMLLLGTSDGWKSSIDGGATLVDLPAGPGTAGGLLFQDGRFYITQYLEVYSTIDGQSWELVYEHATASGIGLPGALGGGYGTLAAFNGINGVILASPYSGGLAIPDADGWYLDPATGTTYTPSGSNTLLPEGVALSAIVADLFERVGIPSTAYDVSALTDEVIGYRIASEGGVDSYVAPLMQAYFFDVGEWDGKLRCIKRGGNSVLTLTTDDLAEKDGDAIEQTRVQEAELLRKVTASYIDPDAVYTPFVQQWERRSATVQAKGEGTVQVPVVMSGDSAAQVAEKRGKVAWSETDKFALSLPYRRAKVTPTDVVTLYDFDGEAHRVRVMGVEEDSGVLHIEGVRDRQAAYTGTATGVAPTPPIIPGAALIGPTQLAVMNLPALQDADDGVGLYVAGRGYFSGWTGALVRVSTDGVSYSTAAAITTPSAIGYTTAALSAVDPDFPDEQTLTVYLPSAPSSVDYDTLLRYSNRAAIQSDSGDWEILQYQTVTALGNDLYQLSGLVRGRYDTTAGSAASSATFVLIDTSLQFVPIDRSMIGQTFDIKAVSIGTDPDATAAVSYDFATCASQTEWSPVELSGTRDGSDNVTVDWVGRARLGTEVSPHQSQYFDGYRVTYSDGVSSFSYDVARTGLIVVGSNVVKAEVTTHEYTAAMQTSDFGSVPSSLTVTVAAMNLITGASASSDPITV